MHKQKCFAFLFSLVFAVTLFLVSGCATGSKEQQSTREISPAQNNEPASSNTVQNYFSISPGNRTGLIIIGVGPRLMNRSDSIQSALNDAARKLSFYYSVEGGSETVQHIGSHPMDVHFGSDYWLKYDDNFEAYAEALEYDENNDIFESNNAFFVVTRVPSITSASAFRGHSASPSCPNWVNSPPAQIDGFIAGVGFSGRLSSHRDTITRSYEKAVIAIIEKEVSIQSDYQQVQKSGLSGTSTQSSGSVNSAGVLKNFYVIESWTDPSNLSVWTLAIASTRY